MLTIKAATRDSGLALYNALQEFYPELDIDEAGECFVTVGLGSDRRVLDVFETIQGHLADRAAGAGVHSMSVALDDGTRFAVPTNGQDPMHRKETDADRV
jgi:hypothetical protein